MLHQSGISRCSLITHDACPEPVWTRARSEAAVARCEDPTRSHDFFLSFFICKTCFGLVAVGQVSVSLSNKDLNLFK